MEVTEKDAESTILAQAEFGRKVEMLKAETNYLLSLKDTISATINPYPTPVTVKLIVKSPKQVTDTLRRIQNAVREVAESAGAYI